MQEIVMTFQIGDPGHCSDDDVIHIKAVRRTGGLTVDRGSKSLDIHTAANQVVLVGRAHPGLKHLITHAPRHHRESMTTFGSVLLSAMYNLRSGYAWWRWNGMPCTVCTTAGTRSDQAALRPKMPALDECVCTTSGFQSRIKARSSRSQAPLTKRGRVAKQMR